MVEFNQWHIEEILLDLDSNTQGAIPIVYGRQGDKDGILCNIELTQQGVQVPQSWFTGKRVYFESRGNGVSVRKQADGIEDGIVKVVLPEAVFNNIGLVKDNFLRIEDASTGNTIISGTSSFQVYVRRGDLDPNASAYYLEEIENIVSNIDEWVIVLKQLLEQYANEGQAQFDIWFRSVKEVLYGVDPGGNILRELIESRKDDSGYVFPNLKTRLDNFERATTAQLQQIATHKNEFINAKEVGADPTGVVNCTLLIQGYIDAGYDIFFPTGTYLGSFELKTHTIIKGESKDTLIKAPSGATHVLYADIAAHHYEIHNLTVSGNYIPNIHGILLSNTGKREVQDTEPIITNVKIVNCRIGMEVQNGVRGGLFRNINAGECDTGFAHRSTDCIYDSCIAAMCQFNGFLNTVSNNLYSNCKAFCCGLSNLYGAGFKNQGSFNRFIGCEAQQNVFESFYNQNANSNIIQVVLDGSGYQSAKNFPTLQYPDDGSGELVPISNLRSYNSKHNIIDATVINGRIDSVAKCAFFCQYQPSDRNNMINLTTLDTTETSFSEFICDDANGYYKNNAVKINSKKKYNKTFEIPAQIDSNLEVLSGGYLRVDDTVFVSITVKALKTQAYGSEMLSSMPRPLLQTPLQVGGSKTAILKTNGTIAINPSITLDETFTIVGSYIVK